MDITPVSVFYYRTPAGRTPFGAWLRTLDKTTQGIIDSRLIRIRRGLFGDAKSIGQGVWELRFNVGPGYRVYFGRDGKTIVILLSGGHKKGQSRDIESARSYWVDYLRRTRK